MMHNNAADLENPLVAAPDQRQMSEYDIQSAHKKEVLRRLAPFKDSNSGIQMEPMPEEGLGPAEKCAAIFLNIIAFVMSFFCFSLLGFYTVQPKEAVIFQVFGKILFIKQKPGLYYCPIIIGRTEERVTTAIQTLQVNDLSVPDLNGSPMNVSAIVNFAITEPAKAKFAVNNLHFFINNQAQEVVKMVCAQFLYRHNDPQEVSLLSDSKFIGTQLREILQVRCVEAGVAITRMELMEFAYHAEVAQSLLQVQQAQAKMDARKLIVEGSVNIVDDALKRLEGDGIKFNKKERADFTKKMMIITCSDHEAATPVVKV